MYKRIYKTILLLSLCVGVVLPTNAAVSVSDGSAFVTKAEFSADLNNLSNRMAQLENSLDAKIDSLVSSYLTRNGIWNGSKQTLAKAYTDTWCTFRANNGGSNITLAYPAALSYSYWSYVRRTTTDGSVAFCTSNKSGLMLITMEIKGGLYNRTYSTPGTAAGSSAGAGSLLWKYYLNGSTVASVAFGSANTQKTVGDTAKVQRVIGVYDQKLSTLFFVAKDDVVTYDIVLSMMWGATTTWGGWSYGTGGTNAGAGADLYGYAYVNSCDVY